MTQSDAGNANTSTPRNLPADGVLLHPPRRRGPADGVILAPVQAKRPAKKTPASPPPTTPCEHRGEQIGQLDCTCANKPPVHACRCEHTSHDMCLLQPKPSYTRLVLSPSGERIYFDGLLPVCADCQYRQYQHPHQRSLSHQDLQWISTGQLVEDGLRLVPHVTPDTVGVIGVPRSGMIPAAAVAAHCHLPLYELTPTGPRQMTAGSRGRNWVTPRNPRFLLIDDSSHNGGAMQRARHILAGHRVTYAAVYTLTPDTVDVYARLLDQIHIFDWNIFNNGLMQGLAIDPRLQGEGFMLDWDGILSPDPTWRHTDQAEAQVRAWMRDVKPLRWIPRAAPIPYVVSFRLEKHRSIMVEWLRRWRITVDQLILHPATTFAARDANFDVVEHKARRFSASNCSLFIESCPAQSRQIAEYSGKPVLCPPAKRFFFQGDAA